ncbi:MAG: hypothetical protein QXE05_08100 [Nitrososphaeria archaeon]
MPGIRKVVVEENGLLEQVKALVKARRYHVISIWLPGSKRHAQHSLPSDRYLITAYRVKDIQRRKRKVGSENEKTQS